MEHTPEEKFIYCLTVKPQYYKEINPESHPLTHQDERQLQFNRWSKAKVHK